MTIPATFPAHWLAAIDRGDASGFKAEDDFADFFRATSMVNGGCFNELSDGERDNVVSLRDSYPAVIEAARRAATKEREASPRFIGNLAAGRPAPTIAQLQPELAAIEAEIGKMQKAPAASLDAMAEQIYAKRRSRRA